ncbi:SDR family NAD(P)-dependent oxidoreductase [Rhodobacterales bacterium HKCCE2091]|nr:SDR family NAD(P)-dependent oxidoreductase [Rhodobacterales bacterium HKCCE2091]
MTDAATIDPGLNAWGQPRITSRFDDQTTAAEVLAGVDLAGRTAMVTGGAGGIGKEIARALAGAGASVVIADVDIEAAALTAGELSGDVRAERLDLADLAATRDFAARFVESRQPLDILVNNAGVMAPPLKRTADSHELQLGINHLGHAALTLGLMPALKAAGGARVVCVSSIGHRRSDVIYDDPDYLTRPYDRWEAYGQSKTACALFAIALNARVSGDGVYVNAMNPGGSMTGLQRFLTQEELRALGWIDADGTPLARWHSPEQCAATSVWLATSDDLNGIGGRYFEYCQEAVKWVPDGPMAGVQPHLNAENAERLWSLTEHLLGQGSSTT